MKSKSKSTKSNVLVAPELGKTKKISVWINGESQCNQLTLNPKDFKNWMKILAHISNVIQPNFGKVKKLVALSTMQPVLSFDELETGEKYVALGLNMKLKLIPGGYGANADKPNQKKQAKKLFYTGDLNSKSIPFLQAMQKKKLTVVYIAISGRTRPPQKVIFNEHDMKDWNLIRNYLAKLLGIAEGVQYICSIYGDILEDASQFQHGYLYVVVPFTYQFVHMDYASLSGEKYNYRRNFMPPVLPAFNADSLTRAPGLDKNLNAKSSLGEGDGDKEKDRPKKDAVKEERPKVEVIKPVVSKIKSPSLSPIPTPPPNNDKVESEPEELLINKRIEEIEEIKDKTKTITYKGQQSITIFRTSDYFFPKKYYFI